jgi:hypothetical protein
MGPGLRRDDEETVPFIQMSPTAAIRPLLSKNKRMKEMKEPLFVYYGGVNQTNPVYSRNNQGVFM